MGILRGTAGGRDSRPGKADLAFPVFSGPLLVFGVKDLRQATPSHIADEDFLFLRRGQCRAVGLVLLEEWAYKATLSAYLVFARQRSAVFPWLFGNFSGSCRCPCLFNIFRIRHPPASRLSAASLLSALFSMVAC